MKTFWLYPIKGNEHLIPSSIREEWEQHNPNYLDRIEDYMGFVWSEDKKTSYFLNKKYLDPCYHPVIA